MKRSKKIILGLVLLVIVLGSVSLFTFNKLIQPATNEVQNSTTVNNGETSTNSTTSNSTSESQETTETSEEPEENPYEGTFELPIKNASGYAPIDLEVKSQADSDAETEETLEPGTAFRILQEEDDWWEIESEETQGWIEHQYAFINLPDVLPSAAYNNTNTYSSLYRSVGIEIPEVTDHSLYDSKAENERLGKEEFIIPVLYTTAKKIYEAQSQALENGETLLIYETYRPHNAQEKVYDQLTELAEENDTVKAGADTAPWEMFWFINDDVSNHQKGFAIDVSLAQIDEQETNFYGDYSVDVVEDYTEYEMPSPMHELSSASAVFTQPVTSLDEDAWKDAELRPEMNQAALALQGYFVNAGMTPLASEWWHFNDLEAREQVEDNESNGEYTLKEVMSTTP
ncbi:MAG: D-alanyl-D-alanine carboxypeptidase family protein [Tetragenococcus sp.]|nr:D-alanyl-D-alanine carboxypeptidase family protein [Tetragenococcus sp.]